MDYHCTICNKKYKSYQSLWNHNHKYHTILNPQKLEYSPQTFSSTLPNSSNKLLNKQNKKLTCDFCEKIFSRVDNLKRHKLNCDKNKSDKLDQIKEELREELKKEFQVEINKLKKPTTNIKVHGNIIGTNTYNGPKQVIYKTGTENMNQISYDEVSTIFDNEISSVIKLIELVNFSELKPENHASIRDRADLAQSSLFHELRCSFGIRRLLMRGIDTTITHGVFGASNDVNFRFFVRCFDFVST